MKSSEDDTDEPPLRSALRSGPGRASLRVSFSPGAEPGAAVGVVRAEGRGRDESTERPCRLLALTTVPVLDHQMAADPHRPPQSRLAQMSAVLGGLLELVERHCSGPRSLQRNTAFLGGAYDLLSELMSSGGGASVNGGGVMLTPVNSEVMVLRRRLERTEQQLERMKKRLVETLKENYELKRKDCTENEHNINNV